MAEELLDRIRREIAERKEASRAAFEESRRLEAALAALNAAAGGDAAAPEPAESPRAPGRGRSASGRAPRGENRRRLLEALADRPGATAAQLAQVTGIARPTAASTLAKLAADAHVRRVELPGGAVGFELAGGGAPAGAPEAEDTEEAAAPAAEDGADSAAAAEDGADEAATDPGGDEE